MEQVLRWIESSDEFSEFLSNPVIGIDERKEVINSLSKRALFSPLSTNFLLLLADKRRLSILDQIVERFIELLDKDAGILRASVHSAKDLSAVQVNRLRAALQEMTGKKVEVSTAVDDSLIGGLVVKMEGKVYDDSVKAHLATLRENVRRL
jgi:F-type H+-transporting ATPase subunit delta